MAEFVLSAICDSIKAASKNTFYNEKIKFPPLKSNKSNLQPIDQSSFLQKMNETPEIEFNSNMEELLKSDITRIKGNVDANIDYYKAFYPFFLRGHYDEDIRTTKLFALYLLELALRSQPVRFSFPECVFQSVEGKELIFSEEIFPLDPTSDKYEFDYVRKVDYLLFQLIKSISKEHQEFLYNKIYEYCYSNDQRKTTIYNFLPIFIKISNEDTPLDIKETFLSTRLFSTILGKTENDITLFDIIRFFVQKNPFQSYMLNESLVGTLSNLYFKVNYQGTVVDIITTSLNEIIQLQKQSLVNVDQLNVIKILEKIINHCNSNPGTQNEFLEIYPAVINYFPQFSKNIFEFIIEENIFEDLATLSIFSVELFQYYIQLLTRMYSHYYEFEYRMSSRKYKIYDILEKYKENKDHRLPELLYLEQLSFCSEEENNDNKYIRNYKGIEVMVSLSSLMGEKELEFSKFLSNQTKNKGNLLELSRAKVPELILKRLQEIERGELEDIVSNYLEIFECITSTVFNNSTFYRTIENLRQKSFDYGNEVIDIIKRLLINNQCHDNDSDEPKAFFRLDASMECGIFGPKLRDNIISKFSINFCVRVNQFSNNNSNSEAQTSKTTPLVYIQSKTSKVKIGLEVDKNRVYLNEEDSKGKLVKHEKLPFRLEQGQWEFLQISFKKKLFGGQEIKIYHKSEVCYTNNLSNAVPRDSYIFIGTKSDDSDSPSLMCDISTIIILEGENLLTIKDLLNSEEKVDPKIASELNPTNGHERICFDTGNNNENIVEYRGRSIPFIPNIYEIFQTVGSLINILPLFKHKERKDEDTTRFYISLIQIFKRMISLTKNVKEIFTESRFFELLLSFLLGADKKALTSVFMKELYEFYRELYPIEELRYQMAQYIILNYTFIMGLEKKVCEDFITNTLPKVIEDQNSDSYHYSYLPSFIFQTYKFFSKKSKASDTAWKILTTMIKHNINYVRSNFKENHKKHSYGYIMMVYKFMMNLKSVYTTINSLEILKSLLCDGYNEVNECFKDEEVIGPFVGLMNQKHDTILILTLEVLDKLKGDIDFHKAIFQCIYALDEEYEIPLDLIKATYKLFIVYDEKDPTKFIEFNAHYLPFLSHCCRTYVDDGNETEPVKEICDNLIGFMSDPQLQKKAYTILEVPCWYDWMQLLYRIVYDPATEYKMFSSPFSSLLEIDFRNCDIEPLKLLFYSLDNSEMVDTRKVQRSILSKLVHENQISQKQVLTIFPQAFDHLMFEREVVVGKENSFDFVLREITQENVDKEDIELAKKLVISSLEDGNGSANTTTIGGVLTMNLILADSIIASTFLCWKPDEYVEALKQIKRNFSKNDPELNLKCSCILVEQFLDHEYTEGEEELKAEIASFDKYLTKNGAKVRNEVIRDRKQRQFNDITAQMMAIQGNYLVQAQKVINERRNDKETNLGVEIDYNDKEGEERARELFNTTLLKSMVNSDTAHGVRYDHRKFMAERGREYVTEVKRILKMKESFLYSLSKRPGPWLDGQNKDTKYKAFNFISKKGQRIMLRINNHFDKHAEACEYARKSSINKDNLKEQSLSIEDYVMPYKTEEEVDQFYLKTNQFNVILQKIVKTYDGIIKFTNKTITFISGKDQEENDDGNADQNEDQDSDKKITIDYKEISFILNRRVCREEKGCEIFLENYKSYFIIFPNEEERNRFYVEIDRLITPIEYIEQKEPFTSRNNKVDIFHLLRLKYHCIHQKESSMKMISNIKLNSLWQENKLTNYEYLYYLNILGGRSFNYPCQYPIFPLLIKECNSDNLDLTDTAVYRDLNLLPIKFNQTAFQNFIDEYKNLQQEQPSLFYTAPSNILNTEALLFRVEPFTTLQVTRNNSTNDEETFNDADQQFYSIPAKVKSEFFSENNKIVFESIPEFYTFPFMMFNENKFDFGQRTEEPKGPIDNVILPPWCQFKVKTGEKDEEDAQVLNANVFTAVNRIALESEYVSANLHKWIDLYFTNGRGYCYKDDNNTKNQEKYQMYESYAYPEIANPPVYVPEYENIGMLPEILFSSAHVPKKSVNWLKEPEIKWLESLPKINKEVVTIIKGIALTSNSELVDLHIENSVPVKLPDNIGELQCIVRDKDPKSVDWTTLAVFCTKSNPSVTVFSERSSKKLHAECHIASTVTSVASVGNKFLIVGGSDCSLSVWEVGFRKVNRQDEFEIKPVCTSCFHSDEIAAIGGCYENGLVVSLDKQNILVFETLFDQKFICFVDLNCAEFSDAGEGFYEKTQISVFKSGVVAVSQKDRILFFDCHGRLLYKWNLNCETIFESRKYYDADTRELLIVSNRENEESKISIFDLTIFRPVETLSVKFEHLCPVNKSRKVVISSNEDGFSTIDFSHVIKTSISPK